MEYKIAHLLNNSIMEYKSCGRLSIYNIQLYSICMCLHGIIAHGLD